MSQEEDPIELETFAKDGRPVPPGKRYRIRIDTARFVVESPITGRVVLALVGKSPNEWDLILKMRPQGQRPVGPDEPVDLTTPGVERFVTMKRQVMDGEEKQPRREVRLRPSDAEFLDSLGVPWEVIREGGVARVLVPGVVISRALRAVHPHPDIDRVSVALRLEGAYPDTQIDMAAFYPPLQRRDGRAIPNVSDVAVDGRVWQQWSRHRPDAAAWRPDVDGVDTHYAFILSWIEREATR